MPTGWKRSGGNPGLQMGSRAQKWAGHQQTSLAVCLSPLLVVSSL